MRARPEEDALALRGPHRTDGPERRGLPARAATVDLQPLRQKRPRPRVLVSMSVIYVPGMILRRTDLHTFSGDELGKMLRTGSSGYPRAWLVEELRRRVVERRLPAVTIPPDDI